MNVALRLLTNRRIRQIWHPQSDRHLFPKHGEVPQGCAIQKRQRREHPMVVRQNVYTATYGIEAVSGTSVRRSEGTMLKNAPVLDS